MVSRWASGIWGFTERAGNAIGEQMGKGTFLEYYRGKRVLVTGGTGFIGSSLCHALVAAGADVAIISSHASKSSFNLHGIADRLEIFAGDLCEPHLARKAVAGCELVFHTAGRASHIGSMEDPLSDAHSNVMSALCLLQAIKKAPKPLTKIVYTGTRAQYGPSKSLPVREDHPKNPVAANGINKQAAEDFFLLYSSAGGPRACCLRLGNIYGPRMQMRNPKQSFISLFVRRAIEGGEITVFGQGAQKRDFTYIDDLVCALLLVGSTERTDSEVYNVGGFPGTVLDVARLAVGFAGSGRVASAPYDAAYRSVEMGDFAPDCSKIRALGWEARVGLQEGLKETVEYYKKNRGHYW